jgi:hypothetical protein
VDSFEESTTTPAEWLEESQILAAVVREGRLIHINSRWKSALGWGEAALTGATALTFVHTDDLKHCAPFCATPEKPTVESLFRMYLAPSDVQEDEYDCPPVRWVWCRSVARILEPSSTPIWYSVLHDVTDSTYWKPIIVEQTRLRTRTTENQL